MKYAIGIDLGGTFIKYALISRDGDIVFDGKLPTMADVSANKVIEQLQKAVGLCLECATENSMVVEGVGIGTPGITDAAARIVLGGADNIKDWSNICLADEIENKFSLRTFVHNDANMMGLGEQAFGAAKGSTDVLFITVGTGIGGAIIIDSKLYGGYQNRGTELGHLPFVFDGLPCTCGSVGCWEAYASTSAMIKFFADKAAEKSLVIDGEIDGKKIVDLYHQDNCLAKEVIDTECNYLGRGVASLVNIFSPQKVVIGGGISESGDFFIEKIADYTKRYAMPDCSLNTIVAKAQLGNKAGVMGAAQIVFISL